MSRLSRAVRRVLVMGAVAALGTVLIAPVASGSESSSSSLDPPGVNVPGLEAEKVSGEAAGCHSEIELDIDPQIELILNSDASAQGIPPSAVTDALSYLPDTQGVGYLDDLMSAVQGQVQQSEASAADSDANEVFHQEVGPVPTVELPWQGGGPVTEEEDECTLDLFGFIPIPLASDLKVETEGAIGPAGYAHTEADASDTLGLLYFADQIDSECLATLEDIEAKTDIEDGEYIDVVNLGGGSVDFILKDLPEHPKKNDELTDFSFSDEVLPGVFLNIEYSLTANEQDDEKSSVDVTGIHSEFLLTIVVPEISPDPLLKLTIEGIRSQSHCDIHSIGTVTTPADVVVIEPKFTG